MKTRSRFSLSAEIHLQYFLHTLVLVPLCMLICKLIVGDEAIFSGLFFAGIDGLLLYFDGASGVMSTYMHNKLGSERVSREMYRHRDIFYQNTDAALYWRYAKRVGHYRSVIPFYVLGITFTTGICLIFEPEHSLWPLGLLVFLIGWILVSISNAYVNLHLDVPEMRELYRDPASFSRVLDYMKQEEQQRQQDIDIQAQLEQEQARNQGLPPDDSQYHRPPKPY